ncbi:MAG: S4 domain-containing protein [Pseudomonadota bacterium]|nr:S4 domain-containing protein [Pseudomonadota bacterium]
MARTRSLAARLVAGGHVRLNARRIETPAKPVGPGDVLTIALERQVRVLKVVAPGARRSGFSEASLLFEELTPGSGGSGICPPPGPPMVLFKPVNIPRTAPWQTLPGLLQKSCKYPWTIWANRANVNYPHGIDRVLHYGRRQGATRARARSGKFWKDCDIMEFRSMVPFSTLRFVNGIASREGNRQLFSMILGIGPLTGRAGDVAFAREGK